MKFTNVTRAGLYFTCCHREVEPLGSFDVPWSDVRDDRAIRSAMAGGALAWESGPGEPHVPGSAAVPTVREREEADAAREAREAAARAEDDEAFRRRVERDNAGVRANMANMGRFKVPGPVPLRQPERVVPGGRPVTEDDIISDDKPQSLEEVMRHNRAMRMFRKYAGASVASGGKGAGNA